MNTLIAVTLIFLINDNVRFNRTLRWVGLVARTGARRGTYRILVGKHGARDNLVYRLRMENNFKINFYEVGWGHELVFSGSV